MSISIEQYIQRLDRTQKELDNVKEENAKLKQEIKELKESIISDFATSTSLKVFFCSPTTLEYEVNEFLKTNMARIYDIKPVSDNCFLVILEMIA